MTQPSGGQRLARTIRRNVAKMNGRTLECANAPELGGISETDATTHHGQMNSIGWMVGHMANQEHRYSVVFAQGREVVSGLRERVGTGRPASTPPPRSR